jgi:hypothetical protein
VERDHSVCSWRSAPFESAGGQAHSKSPPAQSTDPLESLASFDTDRFSRLCSQLHYVGC